MIKDNPMKVYIVTIVHLEPYSCRNYLMAFSTLEKAMKVCQKKEFVDSDGELWGYSKFIRELVIQ